VKSFLSGFNFDEKCKKIKEIISYHPIGSLLSVASLGVGIGGNNGDKGQNNDSYLNIKVTQVSEILDNK